MAKTSASQLRLLKIGWVPSSADFSHPADKRTFGHYARIRGLNYEVASLEQKYDIVYLSQRADITQWANYGKGKLIYEFSDAYLAESQQLTFKTAFRGLAKFVTRQNRYLRLSYRKALEDMLKRADAVLCGTEEQRDLIEPFNRNIHFIIAFQDSALRSVKNSYRAGSPFNLVWEGFPALDGFVKIASALETLKRQQDFALHLITDIKRGRYMNDYLPAHTKNKVERIFPFRGVYLYEWNRQMFSRIVTGCDLAIIPIPMDKPFWVGKPANKLVLFWRMGLPTLTSPTPAYKKMMGECGLDMTCSTPAEWKDKLKKYMSDETARGEAGRKAKAFVDAEYSEEKLLERWDRAFSSILE